MTDRLQKVLRILRQRQKHGPSAEWHNPDVESKEFSAAFFEGFKLASELAADLVDECMTEESKGV